MMSPNMMCCTCRGVSVSAGHVNFTAILPTRQIPGSAWSRCIATASLRLSISLTSLAAFLPWRYVFMFVQRCIRTYIGGRPPCSAGACTIHVCMCMCVWIRTCCTKKHVLFAAAFDVAPLGPLFGAAAGVDSFVLVGRVGVGGYSPRCAWRRIRIYSVHELHVYIYIYIYIYIYRSTPPCHNQ